MVLDKRAVLKTSSFNHDSFVFSAGLHATLFASLIGLPPIADRVCSVSQVVAWMPKKQTNFEFLQSSVFAEFTWRAIGPD